MKPGFFTSEFFLHILALLGPAVYGAFAHSGDPALMIAAQVAAGLYTLSRTILKAQAAAHTADAAFAVTIASKPAPEAPAAPAPVSSAPASLATTSVVVPLT